MWRARRSRWSTECVVRVVVVVGGGGRFGGAPLVAVVVRVGRRRAVVLPLRAHPSLLRGLRLLDRHRDGLGLGLGVVRAHAQSATRKKRANAVPSVDTRTRAPLHLQLRWWQRQLALRDEGQILRLG